MKTSFKSYVNEQVKDPLFNHENRMKKGYRPKYRSGLIAIRFLDDEQYKFPEPDKYPINFQEIFGVEKSHMSSHDLKFVENFEKKYDIKVSNYRKNTSDFHIYFSCTPGTEEQKLKEISKDEIVKDIDYVDVRNIEGGEELEEISKELLDLSFEYGEMDSTKSRRKIQKCIQRLHNLI